MAQQRSVVHIDDLDGKPLAEDDHHAELFAVNGYVYAIDLSAKHHAAFLAVMEKYTRSAHVVGRLNKHGQFSQFRGGRTHLDRERLQQVRTWARANGYPDLSERGRIPAEVLEAFDTAHAAPRTRSGGKRGNGASAEPAEAPA